MREGKATRLEAQLATGLDQDRWRAVAREVGFCQRQRVIDPADLALSLITSLGSHPVATLADLYRDFLDVSEVRVSIEAFRDRLAQATFGPFMLAVHNLVASSLCLHALRPLPGNPFGRFTDILLQDGTSYALYDRLAKHFPGKFHKTKPAAVELHATMSLYDDDFEQVTVTPGVDPERDYLPPPEELRGKLLLADRGYHAAAYFQQVDQHGGHYVIRGKNNLNPMVTAVWHDQRLQPLATPMPLQDYLRAVKTESVDVQVKWQVRKETYVGRVVWLRNDGDDDPILLCTNLPWESFNMEHVCLVYRLRWQVELLFKEWKSYANLHSFETSSDSAMIGLIWASLTAALWKRFLAHAAQIVHRVGISTRKVAMTGGRWLVKLAKGIREGLLALREVFNETLTALAEQGKRASLKEDRRHGRLQLGFAPAYSL